jgi:hypothetical protein
MFNSPNWPQSFQSPVKISIVQSKGDRDAQTAYQPCLDGFDAVYLGLAFAAFFPIGMWKPKNWP